MKITLPKTVRDVQCLTDTNIHCFDNLTSCETKSGSVMYIQHGGELHVCILGDVSEADARIMRDFAWLIVPTLMHLGDSENKKEGYYNA